MSRDGRGRSSTRTEQGWSTVASGTGTQPFYLRDDSGAVLVRPHKAKLHPATLLTHRCDADDPMYYAKGPPEAVAGSTGQRRFIEHGFALHSPVYVIGRARERSDVVAPEIAHDEAAEVFIISSNGEEQVVSGYRAAAIALGIAGALVLLAMLLWWDYLQGRAWQTRGWFHGIAMLGYVGCWTVGWAWSVYNGLVVLRNRVIQGLSLVDIQLQRRSDLIPNLVRVAEAIKGHERRVQTGLTALRAQAGAMHALSPALIALQEHYPELKSDREFLALQKELVSTENRIALARDYFNSIATHFNSVLEQFPDRIVAFLAMLKPRPLLAARDFEREAVHVEFATGTVERRSASPAKS